MSGRLELYTPWREDARRLRGRTVGREETLAGLVASIREFSGGGRPLHRYMFGPRGVGKSHVLALLRAELVALGLEVVWVPEDIPAIRRPEDLLRHISAQQTGTAGWSSWGAKRADPLARMTRRTVLVIEGLDRRLTELGSDAEGRELRQRIRAQWDQDNLLWIIGSGVELPTPLTDSKEPFFGWFHTEAILPLDDDDAGRLLDHVACVTERPSWPARRAALVALAGGSPRVLVTLAETCADPDTPEAASEALLTAVERFTPHFQLRFRDLADQAQSVVDLLATAPREVSPGEIAERLGWEQATASKVAGRLHEDGVLSRRRSGAHVWYGISEPLLRFWIEYRTGPWTRTRVALAANLLEAMFSPREIVAWWLDEEDTSPVVERAVMSGKSAGHAAVEVRERLRAAVGTRDLGGLKKALKKPGPQGNSARSYAAQRCVAAAWAEGLRAIAGAAPAGLLGPTATSAADLLAHEQTPREVFRAWLRAVREVADVRTWRTTSALLLAALDATATAGSPWRLDPQERAQVATYPFLRAALLQRGRLASHAPVLDPGDLAGVRLDPAHADLGELLGAAMARSHDGLAERVLEVASGRALTSLGTNPVAARPAPRPELLVIWMLRDLASGQLPVAEALTWSRSFASIPEELLEKVLALFRSGARQLSRAVWRAGEGLVALGLAAPDRLARVLAALPDDLQQRFDHLVPFVDQLLEQSGGKLHPELARIRERLSGVPG